MLLSSGSEWNKSKINRAGIVYHELFHSFAEKKHVISMRIAPDSCMCAQAGCFVTKCKRPQASGVCSLALLEYEALSY